MATVDYVPTKSPYATPAELRGYLEREFQAIARAINAALASPAAASLPELNLADYGLAESASAATNAQAFHDAIDVAGTLGGAVLRAPPGTFNMDPVTIDEDNVWIRCAGRGTIWQFNPAAEAVLFDWNKGAQSIMFGGLSQCRFHSSNTVKKTAIRVNDGRSLEFDHCKTSDSGWPGDESIGAHFFGRDSCVWRKNQMRCARPVVFDVNPNFATIHTDFFLIEDNVDGSTLDDGKCYEIADGVNYTHIHFHNNAIVLGKYGIYWNDTSSPIGSYGLMITQQRTEQATTSNPLDIGFAIYLATTIASPQQDICIRGLRVEPERNGIYLRNFRWLTVDDAIIVSSDVALDITFTEPSFFDYRGLYTDPSATVTLTNATKVESTPFNSSLQGLATSGFYRFTSDRGPVAFGVPLGLPSYTVAGVPSASLSPNALIYVSNESGGAVPAFSDGTNWRRVTDRTIIS